MPLLVIVLSHKIFLLFCSSDFAKCYLLMLLCFQHQLKIHTPLSSTGLGGSHSSDHTSSTLLVKAMQVYLHAYICSKTPIYFLTEGVYDMIWTFFRFILFRALCSTTF